MLAFLLAVVDETPHSAATLVAGLESVRPGQVVPIVLKITLDPGWHTYWLNPGDSGSPTQVRWKVNGKPVAPNLLYPAPKVISSEGITTYGYEGEVILVTSLIAPATLSSRNKFQVEAEANWLVCKEECVMARTKLTLELPTQTNGPAAPIREEVQKATDALPRALKGTLVFKQAKGNLVFEGSKDVSLVGCTFLPHQPGIIDHSAPQRIESGRLLVKKSPYLTKLPSTIKGVLLRPNGAPALTILFTRKK